MEIYRLLRTIITTCDMDISTDEIREYLKNVDTIESLAHILIFLEESEKIDEEEREIIEGIIDYQSLEENSEITSVVEAVLNTAIEGDFYIEIDNLAIRIIKNDVIWSIYKESIEELVTDCYDLNLDNMPSFVDFTIDWQGTAQNCFIDGYGHHFSGYDSSEHETTNFWYFLNNK
jgi:hypothetical protein